MAFVQTRTDQTKYSAVDGVVGEAGTAAATASATGTFGSAVQASKGGFGVIDPYTGTFEVLDALPLGKQSVQLAVEAGSAAVAATVGGGAAGFTAIDFATQDLLTTAEIDALGDGAVDGVAGQSGVETTTDLT
jgi:hypothetical protein